MNASSVRKLMVAVGSPHGDDKAAWAVAEMLTSLECEGTQIRKATVPLDMLDWLNNVSELHIVDACDGGGRPGDLLTCEWSPDGREQDMLHRLSGGGTHDYDVLSVLKLVQQLRRLPEQIVIHAIVGQNFAPADSMSDEIAARLPQIAREIRKDLIDAREISGAIAAEAG